MENNTSKHFKDPPKFRGIFYLKPFLFLAFCFLGLDVFSQAQLKFTETKKKFEDVKKGELVVLAYDFTNAGNEPLIISDHKVECSCTSVEYPKQPIAPGQGGKVIVRFDTKTVWDWQDRVVEIISNSKNKSTKIRFKGNVIKN